VLFLMNGNCGGDDKDDGNGDVKVAAECANISLLTSDCGKGHPLSIH
jgi:hypothetical protein